MVVHVMFRDLTNYRSFPFFSLLLLFAKQKLSDTVLLNEPEASEFLTIRGLERHGVWTQGTPKTYS